MAEAHIAIARTFNVNVVHVHNSQTVPISTPKSPQHTRDSSGAGATESGVASQATLSLNYTPGPWTDTLLLVGPTPRDLLEIYYAKFSSQTIDIGNTTSIIDSTRTSGSVAKGSESIVDRLVVDSLASGTVDPAVLIRTSPHLREKRSQGVMRSQAASDRHHPYNVVNRPLMSRGRLRARKRFEHKSILPRYAVSHVQSPTFRKAPALAISPTQAYRRAHRMFKKQYSPPILPFYWPRLAYCTVESAIGILAPFPTTLIGH
ncbi:hypothetical protein JR316_0011203 [Psilocybe cubensis]|uniref:Uncharacterized protein n=1 Tax=Psilocybe cubensis TaxID=181762 RepID=A0ACB8GJD7_PSICU|nr:hypothetical protein JR316_0011203 [Psilocybe cubensis]KAH9475648.1 hypothetical protein JR316_0011203 [Psilocybe cubensis]